MKKARMKTMNLSCRTWKKPMRMAPHINLQSPDEKMGEIAKTHMLMTVSVMLMMSTARRWNLSLFTNVK